MKSRHARGDAKAWGGSPYPASKLSYVGERSESRENARASGQAARGRGKRVLARLGSFAQTGELARRLESPFARAFSRGWFRLPIWESMLPGYANHNENTF